MNATTAYLGRPALARGEHLIDTARIREDILDRNADHPRRAAIGKALANLPGTRRYAAPYEMVTAPDRPAAQRKTDVLATLLPAAEKAARQAIAEAGLSPGDIDCVIVSSATGDMMPGLDVHLQQQLPLRPDVRRRPMTQLACAGGAHVLIMAEEHLARYPEDTVLVVVGEFLSSLYQDARTALEDQIYKALWGDLTAAAIVSARPHPASPSLRIDRALEYTIPGTLHRYRKETDERGDHFASTRDSLKSVSDLAPVLLGWLDRNTDRPLDFGILHPGGPAILTRLGQALGVDEAFLAHSRDVLAEEGNLGGPTIFSVLDRTHGTPPAHGDQGLIFGLGPGVTFGALLVTWTDPAHRPTCS
ncbi:PhlD [Kitasatospora cinereorecta]|uniref:PhlD n=1 Tax=Kitasatospora cinereorecta TaxID=285560 RepID=A0ABW0VPP4_9ACTN